MLDLTPEGQSRVADIASRHGVSTNAAETLLNALMLGNGNQAQFSHPELGGMGQWSRGGMIMVGDMFNNALKARVDSLCNELSGLLYDGGSFAPRRPADSGAGVSLFVSGSRSEWPEELGMFSSSGAQNNLRYAVFPQSRRLAISQNGNVTIYDTGDHMIGGVSQAQSGDQSLSFTSQYGLVRLSDLPIVTPGSQTRNDQTRNAPTADPVQPEPYVPEIPAPEPVAEWSPTPDYAAPAAAPEPVAPTPSAQPAGHDVIAMIERLAELRTKGILTDEEFSTKKTELLSRM